MRTDDEILQDIVEACKLLSTFVAGYDRDQFSVDLKTRSAVLHQLAIIGEAIKRLSRETRDLYPSVPWRDFAGMRDVLIHGYDIVNLDLVWETVTVDVPNLLAVIEPGDHTI